MKKKLLFGVTLVALVVAALATYSWAASADSQTLNACVTDAGKLRLVSVAGSCVKTEDPVSWNTVGPAGPPGVAGPAGKDGHDGASGGAAADPNAAAGTVTVTGQGFTNSPMTLVAVSHEILSPRDAASGQATGKRQHKPLTITKEIDKATPLLMRAIVTNQTLPVVLISLQKNGQEVATIKLTNAQVSDDVTRGMNETIAFVYQKITFTWVDGGVSAEDDWEAPVARK